MHIAHLNIHCPSLNQQPQDHVVTKRTPRAFTNTDLEAHLRTQAVTQVVIVGLATSNGVEATAREAHELGFNVTLAVDALTDMDMSADAHSNSIARIFPKLRETGTTQATSICWERGVHETFTNSANRLM
jgi:nicotinamidase-related amidase